MGVPNLAEVATYYQDFGLTAVDGASLPSARSTGANSCAGEDRPTPPGATRNRRRRRRRSRPHRVASREPRRRRSSAQTQRLSAREPGTDVLVRVEIADRLAQLPAAAPHYNGPGTVARVGARANGILREDRVRPRKLGHVVLGSTDHEGSQSFFVDGVGLQGQRQCARHCHVHALFVGSPQRLAAAGPGSVSASHLVASRGCR